MSNACELTILMPCLNEAETLGLCVDKARGYLRRSGIEGEVVVADNGSTDGSQHIAADRGARVVDVSRKGYGSALSAGISAARGCYVIMGDSDDSYDFTALDPFVDKLRQGYDLVMGNRFKGGIKPGAMPPLHRYLGNPVLTAIGQLFFHSPCGDFHCGLRGFSRDAILDLNLQAPGMEFASEMVVKATIHRLPIAEVPTTLSPDGRSRPPHLRSWRDGWRHLRFLLLFSPRWLFLYPGLFLAACGLATMLWVVPAPRMVAGVTFDIHTLLYAAVAMVVGVQLVQFWAYAQVYGMREGFVPPDPWVRRLLKFATIERGIITGAILLVVGVALGVAAVGSWNQAAFGSLDPVHTMRLVIPSATSVLLAFTIAYGAFFLNLLEIRTHSEHPVSSSVETRRAA